MVFGDIIAYTLGVMVVWQHYIVIFGLKNFYPTSLLHSGAFKGSLDIIAVAEEIDASLVAQSCLDYYIV